jgi:hypothetical protein
MADESTPTSPSAAEIASAPSAPAAPPIPFNIGEEFGTAKRNLPPVKILLITLTAVLLAIAIYSLSNRAKPQGGGQIDNVASVEVPDQNSVLVAITVTLRNNGEKPLWIHSVEATLTTASGTLSDNGASAVDFDRYFEAFPALKQGARPALTPETKLQPGQAIQGTIVVMFPVTQQVFDQRQSISAVIHPYDQPVPVVLTK